jgi:hypothetical protein
MRALLALLVLVALPARAVEGAVSLELTVGPEFALSLMGELSPVQDRLWLTLGYGLLKAPDVPATETVPKITVSATHLFMAGVDLSPHKSWLFSLQGQVSPRAYESVTLNPGPLVPITDRVTLSTTSQFAGASGAIGFDTAGTSDFEFGALAGVGFNWNRFGVSVSRGAFLRLREEELVQSDLWVVRPTLGLSAVIADRVSLAVRGGYTLYAPPDPLAVAQLNPGDLDVIDRPLAQAVVDKIQNYFGATAAVNERRAALDASYGYASAPVRFDLRSSVQVKFVRAFSLQLAWTYLRYVVGQGFGNVAALKGTFRIGLNWRLWIIASVQLDALNDAPASKTDWSTTGHLSLGGEFGF